jgi:hypothetical protein
VSAQSRESITGLDINHPEQLTTLLAQAANATTDGVDSAVAPRGRPGWRGGPER